MSLKIRDGGGTIQEESLENLLGNPSPIKSNRRLGINKSIGGDNAKKMKALTLIAMTKHLAGNGNGDS